MSTARQVADSVRPYARRRSL